MKEIATAFAPATVSNVGCGFDVLGFAIEGPGDTVTARIAGDGIRIEAIEGDEGRLPRDAASNTAGVAASALLERLFPVGNAPGVSLAIRKGLPLASGLGGSAASAAAAVKAVNALFGDRAGVDVLIACALEGERLGAGSAHPDNVAPAVCGGFVLVRDTRPLDLVVLPVPAWLTAVVVHPHLEIETAKARALLGSHIGIPDAIRQAANLGALVDGLHRSDADRIARAIVDRIAEPRRASLVPWLADVRTAATESGALGAGLSGSGPSVFALCRSRASAESVARAMTAALARHIGGPCETYISGVGAPGARIVSTCVS